MRNMSTNRTTTWLVAWGLVGVLWASAAQAQGVPGAQASGEAYANGNAPYSAAAPATHRPMSPFNPVQFYQEWQPFAPADTSDFGDGPKPNIGFFFSYERVYWALSKPFTAQIGSPTAQGLVFENGFLIQENNSMDTSWIKSTGTYGNRFDLGYMDSNDYGWLVSVIDHVSQSQQISQLNPTVLFNDPNFLLWGFIDLNGDGIDDDLNGNQVHGRDGLDLGTPNPTPPPAFIPPPDGIPDTPAPIDIGDTVAFPPRFTRLDASNWTELNGVELMRMYRAPRGHHGGVWELYYGARWLKVDDRFNVAAFGGILADSFWQNKVENSMVGPQIGTRYSHQRGRWVFSTEGRFMAAANFVSTHFNSTIATQAPPTGGTNRPVNLTRYGSNQVAYDEEFSPVAEFRIQTSFILTRAVALKLGYTGMFIGGLTRASNTVDYTIPYMGILDGNHNQSIYAGGVSFGIEINR